MYTHQLVLRSWLYDRRDQIDAWLAICWLIVIVSWLALIALLKGDDKQVKHHISQFSYSKVHCTPLLRVVNDLVIS